MRRLKPSDCEFHGIGDLQGSEVRVFGFLLDPPGTHHGDARVGVRGINHRVLRRDATALLDAFLDRGRQLLGHADEVACDHGDAGIPIVEHQGLGQKLVVDVLSVSLLEVSWNGESQPGGDVGYSRSCAKSIAHGFDLLYRPSWLIREAASFSIAGAVPTPPNDDIPAQVS